jgi:hypothetical protein
MQFPPYMDQSPVQVYNDRLIVTNTYNYEKQTTLEPSSLKINQYQSDWTGGFDMGFSLYMPFYE